MNRPPPLSRTRRSVTIILVIALHATLLGLFILVGNRAPPPILPPRPIALIEVAVASPEPLGAPPPPPALPSKIALESIPPAPPTTQSSPTSTVAPGGGCATLASVAAAINADVIAASRLQNAPPELRSISGAVVIWNAGWSEGARRVDEPLEPVRRVIEATLRTVDPACLDEQIAGPRLVAIPTGDHSMYAVLGSGKWSWAQMLLPNDSPPVPSVDAAGPLPPPQVAPPGGNGSR